MLDENPYQRIKVLENLILFILIHHKEALPQRLINRMVAVLDDKYHTPEEIIKHD
jgi:hypothetical protein